MVMKLKPVRFNSSPRPARPCESRFNTGFTLLEALAAIVLGAMILSASALSFVSLLKRAWTHDMIAQAESLGSRMSASITSAMKTSSAWSIYPDGQSYLADPVNNVSSQGNALVCQTTTASGQTIVVLFSYQNGRLTRSDLSASNTTISVSNCAPASGYVFNQNSGLVSGSFEIQTPVERLTFNAYGTSLRMR
jgi:Tfp pilus assembly protein FimT